MEFFDVVNENRKLLGYTKQRGMKLEENEYNVGVEIWIINNKKLLITRRSLSKSHPSEWEVPGGCSKAGETSIETLIRETNEEVGISINNSNFELLDTVIYKKQFVDIYKSNRVIDLNDVSLQKDEVCDIKYVTKNEFLKMADNGEIVGSVYNRYNIIKDKLKKDW